MDLGFYILLNAGGLFLPCFEDLRIRNGNPPLSVGLYLMNVTAWNTSHPRELVQSPFLFQDTVSAVAYVQKCYYESIQCTFILLGF